MRSPDGGVASACAPRSPASPSRCSPSACRRRHRHDGVPAQLRSSPASTTQLGTRADRRRQRLIDIVVDDGEADFDDERTTPPTDYFVAIYGPTASSLRHRGRRRRRPDPVFPRVTLDIDGSRRATTPFSLPERRRRARVPRAASPYQVDGVQRPSTRSWSRCPSRRSNQIVATYLGIYSILALIILIAGALAHPLARHPHLPQPRPGRVDRDGDRRRATSASA